ncbi:hypothetical protein B0H11DRAFT_1956550 [Mycena galericulata]|nr:hypothetical protein B0H11DRAFT_2278882 [Mycena galericulata]KAJ7510911.1 hypothetical protein B0H11DRAFT_1956550 [Mycena galericulata]
MADARAADRAHIDDIEAEIFLLKRSIRGLRGQKKRTQQYLNSYKYPVLTLPSELVSEIFLHYIPVYPRCPPRSGRRFRSPMLLAQICRQWREIALATPRLWRAISLQGQEDPSENYIQFLRSWLGRSGDFTLSIGMDDLYSGDLSAAEIEALIPHRAHWEHISVCATLPHLFTMEGPMPQLRTIEIRDESFQFIPVKFDEIPHLCTATLWDFNYPPELLPWSQLTSLALVAKTPSDVTPILQQTPRLVHCELIVYDDGLDPQPTTELLCLESLILMKHAATQDKPTAYLDTFVLPALRRLQIPDEFIRPYPVDALTSFIERSGCNLQEVLITGDIIVPRRSYRDAFPAIKEFSFDRMAVDYMAWRRSFPTDFYGRYSSDSTDSESTSDSE